MLGQPASSQTVCRPSRLTRSLSSVNSGPVRSRVLIQDGLRSIGVWAFLTSRRRSLRPSGVTAVTWSGYAGNAGDRFAGEVAAARRVAGFGTAGGRDGVPPPPARFFVPEYIPGPPLDRAIREQGTLSGSELEALAVGMAAALVAIHAAGLVHRDL